MSRPIQSDAPERASYGGQAVVEGVMMRSPRFFAVACRRLSDGAIVIEREPVDGIMRRWQWLNKPFLRGTLALVDAMSLGMKALTYAANVQALDGQPAPPAAGALDLAMGEGAPVLGEAPPAPQVWGEETLQGGARSTKTVGKEAKQEAVLETSSPPTWGAGGASAPINGIAIGATTVLALLLGFGLFWTLPAVLTDKLLPHVSRFGANLTEGGIRLLVFFGYVGLISRMAHVQRVFQYHGAEHKAINTLESGLPVTVENARAASRIHPRCGTNFIFIVLITAMLVFGVVPRHGLSDGIGPFLGTIGLRLLLLPVVSGIAYEILRWAGANRDKQWAQTLIAPGLATQYLTTRVPDDAQLEVAIAALQSVWEEEHALPPSPVPGEPSASVA